MKTQENFSGKLSREIFQQNFSEFFKKIFQQNFSEFFNKIFQDRNGKDFPQSFVEGAVQNFIAGVGYFAKKTKEVEDDPRKKFCHYPSA